MNTAQAATDFFLYCPPKTGSTSIAHTLSKHPCITGPKLALEPNFFARPIADDTAAAISEYNELFRPKKGALVFEKSTTYFPQEIAIKQILKYCKPDVRFVVVLRNPTERFFSYYRHMRTLKNIIDANPTFMPELTRKEGWFDIWQDLRRRSAGLKISRIDDFCRSPESLPRQNVDAGVYYKHLNLLYKCVDPERILLLKYEDFCKDDQRTMRQIYSFLGVDIVDTRVCQSNTSATWEKRSKLANIPSVREEITPRHVQYFYDYYYAANDMLDDLFPDMRFNYNKEVVL